jgi:hypothetical protein
MELDTVIGSDLRVRHSFSVGGFSQDEYIKQYLLDPDIPLITAVKIGLRYYITSDLILQLDVLKEHLGIPSFKDVYKLFPCFDKYSLKPSKSLIPDSKTAS